MTIGIDCRAISESGGIGEYVRQTVKHLIKADSGDRFVLFFAEAEAALAFRSLGAVIKILPLAKFKKYLPLVYSHLLTPLFLSWQKLTVCWFPANIIPLGYRGRAVVTVHDLAVYKFPELFPDRIIGFDRRVLVPRSLKRASQIIVVSSSTKKDIAELFAIPAEKISVVYEGGDFEFERTEVDEAWLSGLKLQKYFLFIGTIEPRKNLIRLVEAYKKFVQSGGRDFDLVLAGKSGWKNEGIFEAIAAANQELGAEKIKYLGFISNEQKAELYRQAFALILPSLHEGFGLPAAEALLFGLPLVLAGNSALPEIGGGAAVYVEAESVEAIFEALVKISVSQSLRDELASRAYQRAPQFTWKACSQGVLKALQSA